MNYLVTASIVLLGALIKGSTGFGFSMTTLPLLVFQFAVKTVVPIITIWSLTTSLIIILQKKTFEVNKDNYKIIYWGALGTIIGTIFLAHMEEKHLTMIVAIIFAGLTILSMVGVQFKMKHRKMATIRTGLLSGILAGSITISGPPITLFLNTLKISKEEFREIFAQFDLFTSSVALIGFSIAGLVTYRLVFLAVIFIPMIYMGTFLGKRINRLIPQPAFRTLNLFLSLVSCLLLIYKLI